MIRKIIFDYGNVLSLPQDQNAIEAMAQLCGLKRADFEKAYWINRDKYDEGSLTDEEYWHMTLGGPVKHEDFQKLRQLDCESWSHINPLMDAILRDLKDNNAELILFSNMPKLIADYIRGKNAEIFTLFERLFFSYELGLIKPNPHAFNRVLEELKIQADEAYFIDDKKENVEGAQGLGIETYLFQNAEEFENSCFGLGPTDTTPGERQFNLDAGLT